MVGRGGQTEAAASAAATAAAAVDGVHNAEMDGSCHGCAPVGSTQHLCIGQACPETGEGCSSGGGDQKDRACKSSVVEGASQRHGEGCCSRSESQDQTVHACESSAMEGVSQQLMVGCVPDGRHRTTAVIPCACI
eukprot:1150811-Pelagomonas_calceolata.AAC.1